MSLHLSRITPFIVCSLLLLASNVLPAQQDFRPGYIVTAAGDTLAGEVDYRGDLALGSEIRYRSADRKATVYTPGDLTAYGFDDGRTFVAHTVEGTSRFLEQLTTGRITLYYFRDDLGDHYLVDKPGLELSKLEYKESVKQVRGKRVFNRSRSHILLLNYFMQDWPAARERTADLGEPNHWKLIQLLEAYHAAVGEEASFEVLREQPPLIVLNPEITAGYTKYFDVNDLRVPSYAPVGIVAHVWMPRINEKLFFRTGVYFTRFQLEDKAMGYYKVPVQLEYVYPTGAFRPRFAYGPNFNNLTAGTVSGNLGAMLRVSDRLFLTAAYELEFEQEFVVVPVDFLAHSVSVGAAMLLNQR